jgi:hypothetical protein
MGWESSLALRVRVCDELLISFFRGAQQRTIHDEQLTIGLLRVELSARAGRRLVRMRGRLGERSFRVVIFLQEILAMKVHQKVAAVLVSSLGLVSWGCSGEDVESGVKSTGNGIESAGKSVGSGTKSLGEKIKESGTGGKMEKVANATGNAIETSGEKIKEGTEKLGEKIKDKAEGIGKAVEKTEKKIVDGAKNIKDKIVEEGKDLKDKVTGSKKDD